MDTATSSEQGKEPCVREQKKKKRQQYLVMAVRWSYRVICQDKWSWKGNDKGFHRLPVVRVPGLKLGRQGNSRKRKIVGIVTENPEAVCPQLTLDPFSNLHGRVRNAILP